MKKIILVLAVLGLFMAPAAWAVDLTVDVLKPEKGSSRASIGTSSRPFPNVYVTDFNVADDMVVVDDLSVGGDATITGDIDAATGTIDALDGTTATFTTSAQAADITATDDLVVVDDASVGGDLTVTGDVDAATGTIDTLDGTTATFTTLTVNTDAEAAALTVTGTSLLSGDVTGDGGDQIMGFLRTVSAKTEEYTITVAESGSWFTNTGDGDGVILNLPPAVAGLWYCFAVDAAQNMDINPDTADQIIAATNAAGDAIRSSTEGDTICLTAISGAKWVTQSSATWADVN